jgi:hypothetical protein
MDGPVKTIALLIIFLPAAFSAEAPDPGKDPGFLAARDAYWKLAAEGQYHRAEAAQAQLTFQQHTEQVTKISAELPGMLKAIGEACTKAGGKVTPNEKTGNQDCLTKPAASAAAVAQPAKPEAAK